MNINIEFKENPFSFLFIYFSFLFRKDLISRLLLFIMDRQSIYLKNNPYGFKINVNHPKINELYRRYKLWKGLRLNEPLTNKQRFEFEDYIFDLIEKKKEKSSID